MDGDGTKGRTERKDEEDMEDMGRERMEDRWHERDNRKENGSAHQTSEAEVPGSNLASPDALQDHCEIM